MNPSNNPVILQDSDETTRSSTPVRCAQNAQLPVSAADESQTPVQDDGQDSQLPAPPDRTAKRVLDLEEELIAMHEALRICRERYKELEAENDGAQDELRKCANRNADLTEKLRELLSVNAQLQRKLDERVQGDELRRCDTVTLESTNVQLNDQLQEALDHT